MHIKKMYSVATKVQWLANQLVLMYVRNSYLLWQIVTFDYGKEDENPIDHVRFYRKDNPEKAVIVRKDQVSHS